MEIPFTVEYLHSGGLNCVSANPLLSAYRRFGMTLIMVSNLASLITCLLHAA